MRTRWKETGEPRHLCFHSLGNVVVAPFTNRLVTPREWSCTPAEKSCGWSLGIPVQLKSRWTPAPRRRVLAHGRPGVWTALSRPVGAYFLGESARGAGVGGTPFAAVASSHGAIGLGVLVAIRAVGVWRRAYQALSGVGLSS